jgi:WD40 repeat protein
MPKFMSVLAKLAFFLNGLNPIGMRLGDGHCDTSLREYPILLIHRNRLFLLAHNGWCIKLVQRLQGPSSRFVRNRLSLNLNQAGFRLLKQVHRHQNPSCVKVLKAHNSRVINISIHPTAPLMLTGSFDGATKLWYLSENGLPQSCIGCLHYIGDLTKYVAFHPRQLKFASSDNMHVELYEISNFTQIGSSLTRTARLSGHTRPIIAITFHQMHPQFMATASVDGRVGIWFINHDYTAARLKMGQHDDVVFCVAFHPKMLLLASGSRDSTVKLWDIAADFSSVRCVSIIRHSSSVTALEFHPSAKIIVAGFSDGTVNFWDFSSDLSNPTCITTLRGHDGTVNSVKFHKNARFLATSDWGGNVRIWLISPDARHAKLVGQYLHSSSPVFCLAFHPTEQTVVIGCEGGTVKVLE